MSTAAVHLRSPINTSSVDPTPNSPPPLHQSHFPHFTANAMNSSSSATAAAASTARTRSKPRLTKLRKHSARSRTRTAASGFNPFSSDQVTTVNSSDDGSSNGHREDTGFVFSASDPAGVLNSEQGEGASVKETEFGKSGGVEFVFSAKRSETESNSRENAVAATTTVSGEERKVKLNVGLEQREFNNIGFVFNADRNGLVSSSNTTVMGKSSEFVENSGGERKCENEVKCERRPSNLNVKKQESRNSDHVIGSFNTKSQRDIDNDRDAHLGNDNLDKGKSGYGSTNGNSTAYSGFPSCKLTDEMNKLNIDNSEGAGITRDSTNSRVNSSTGFVFGGSEKVTGYSSVSSGTNAGGQQQSCTIPAPVKIGGQFFKQCETNVVQNGGQRQSCTIPAPVKIGGKFFKECETNVVQNGTGCGIAFGSTGIPCSKPSSSQEDIRYFQCGKIPECYVPEDSQVNGAAAPSSASSFGLDSLRNNYASNGDPSSEDNDKCDNCFTSIPIASKESFVDFKPPTWDPSCFKDKLFPEFNKKLESTQKGRSSKEKGSKHMRRKMKPHSLNKKQTRLDHLSKENGLLATPDCSGSHSPMDFSPYHETGADDQAVKASEELNDLHSAIPTDYKDEHFTAVRRGVDTNTTDQRHGDPDNDKLMSCNGSSFAGDFHSSGPETAGPSLKTKQFSSSISASADAGVDFSSNTETQKADKFSFVHGLGASKETDFAFSASSTVEGTSSFKRKQKKKFRRRKGCDSFVISPIMNGKFGSSLQFSPHTTANMTLHSEVMNRSQINDQFKEGDTSYSATIQENCDKWRLRGNQAYEDGDLSKAEEFYTLGINSVPSGERSGCWIKPLLLCYSNRAATLMRLGRIREAVGDCVLASDLDPTFLKVQMRTANCHLLLGEVENANQCFNKCMESGNVVCLDRRAIVEAAEGLQKAQKVVECINNAAVLLKKRTSDAAGTALELLTSALSISSYSEKLLQMKAEALCLLQKYDAAIQLCEHSQYLAEKNFALPNSGINSNISVCDSYSCVKLWRWSLISKCYFHLGRLEASLNVLEKIQQVVFVNDKCVIDNIEDLLSLAATIRELLDHKKAGNENFKSGNYKEAVENYTVALSSNIKSRPFAAICFCNRAAAHQALGQIADAIADCSMAMALNGNYTKAISRRATLYEMVRDYEQAASDLRKLVSVLETQFNEKTKLSDSPGGSSSVKELKQVHQRLLSVEDQSKRGIPLDFYLILGIKPSDTATDIKKAYHKAALRHHPDKAGQLLPRSEVGDEGQVWKEISQEVHKDADKLFKMIGEAYAELSDPAKRSEYDLEEDIRKAYQSNRGGTGRRSSDFYGCGRPSDGYKSTYDRSSNRRYGRDHWKTYGHSYSRW